MDIKVPEVGESIVEALVAKWHLQDGARVEKDALLCELETDKITLELNAEVGGVLSIKVEAGTTVKIGTVIGVIAESPPETATAGVVPASARSEPPPQSPAARKLAREQGVRPEDVHGSGRGGRITSDDLLAMTKSAGGPVEQVSAPPALPASAPEPSTTVRSEEAPEYRAEVDPRVTRQRMTPIRTRIAARLLEARQQTAMLTTFNEADMKKLMALRNSHKDHFLQRHGVPLGIMSFFVKASVEALKEFPVVNARIDGDDIVFQHFYDIGIAVGGEKGLVVPILRDADRLSLAEIEQGIKGMVDKVKNNQLLLADLSGGTFTISNGGVYGSLLSTPILNPPQSAVLGMHTIQDRPVAQGGEVVIRPMMYLALSYDHRLIDGREAVGFLKRIKEYIEDPEELLLEG